MRFWLSWLERFLDREEVRGSNPLKRTKVWTRSSAGLEHSLDKRGVGGSSPSESTKLRSEAPWRRTGSHKSGLSGSKPELAKTLRMESWVSGLNQAFAKRPWPLKATSGSNPLLSARFKRKVGE